MLMQNIDIRQIEVCKRKGILITEDSYILDFGCGDGHRVYQLLDSGYKNSFGFNKGNYMDKGTPIKLRQEQDRQFFRFTDNDTIPFPDNYFDLIISDQVFEHVLHQQEAFREIYRVLKSGGVSVHVIPAKWQIIEPHIFVPFGGLIKTFVYYYFWAMLGIRNNWQKGLSVKETAKRNSLYAKENLHYLSCREYQTMMSEIHFKYSWEELAYMKASYKHNIQKLAALSEKVPLVCSLIRHFYQRVLYLQK